MMNKNPDSKPLSPVLPGKKEMQKSLLTHEILVTGKQPISLGIRFFTIAYIIDVWKHVKNLNSLAKKNGI